MNGLITNMTEAAVTNLWHCRRPSTHWMRPSDIVPSSPPMPREKSFSGRRKLHSTWIILNEDFCPGTIAARRLQMVSQHAVRRDGKYAFFNYRTLIIKEGQAGGDQRGREVDGLSESLRAVAASPPKTPPAPSLR